MNKEKQTAVDWLKKELTFTTEEGSCYSSFKDYVDLSKFFDTAKNRDHFEKEEMLSQFMDFLSEETMMGETREFYIKRFFLKHA